MDDIYLMTVFVAVGEELSFAAAGRRLDISSAAITRAIQHLESSRGVDFLVRDTRGVQLSEVGQRYLDDARSILKLVKEAEENAAGTHITPRGHLRVTAPVAFGRLFIVPAIADYLKRYPEMEISAVFLDRTVNLIDEGFDVAIRIGQLPDSGMKALKVGQVRRFACASPAYLQRHGIPEHPSELQTHKIIATEVSAQNVIWKFGSKGDSISVKLKPVLGVMDNDAAIDAALAGIGIAYLPSYQVMEQVKSGALNVILQEHAGDSLPIHLLHRENNFGSSKVRSFIDLLAEHLRSEHLAH